MKIYRISLECSGDEHGGYEFFTSKKKARKALKEAAHSELFHAKEIDVLEIKLTKDEIMRLLGRWASHPDNG